MIHLRVLPADPASPMHRRHRRFWGEKYLRFRCTDCGNCCVDTIVPVTGQDVLRLMKGTRLPAEQIVAFFRGDEFDDGGDGLTFVELDVGARVMGLRRRFSVSREEDACRFYDGKKCTAYAHRPSTCRLWPLQPTLDEAGRITRLALNDTVDCRYDLEGQVDPERLVANWRRDERQDEQWTQKVDRWNRRHRGGARREFLKFVGLRAIP
jgi:Fe-S-cluster containining protein